MDHSNRVQQKIILEDTRFWKHNHQSNLNFDIHAKKTYKKGILPECRVCQINLQIQANIYHQSGNIPIHTLLFKGNKTF